MSIDLTLDCAGLTVLIAGTTTAARRTVRRYSAGGATVRRIATPEQFHPRLLDAVSLAVVVRAGDDPADEPGWAGLREACRERRILTASEEAAAPGGRDAFTAPVEGPPSARYSRASRGWTWRADGGAEVRAPMNAVVEHAGPLDGWGEVVILDLSPGWRAVIAGLGQPAVGTGDRIADGEVLGRLPEGAEAEVYFELRRDNRPVDPSPWLE